VDGTPLAISSATVETEKIYWSYTPATAWTNGRTVSVSLTGPRGPIWTGVVLESENFLPRPDAQDLTVAEDGSTTFGVRLAKDPAGSVNIRLHKSRPGPYHGGVDVATVSPQTLTFTSGTWNALQTVTVTGVPDADDEHEHMVILVKIESTTTDPIFRNFEAVNGVFLTVTDGAGALQVGAWPGGGREAGNGQSSNATVAVWLSRPASGTVRVNYRTVDGTARSNGTTTAGTRDYTPRSGTITFAAGETRKEVQVPILDDNVEDSGEKFRFVLSNPQGATLEPGYTDVPVEIRNDEALLDGLTVEGASSVNGPWSVLDVGGFASETTDYAVRVPYGTTHVRLAPTTADEDLVLRAGAGSALKPGTRMSRYQVSPSS